MTPAEYKDIIITFGFATIAVVLFVRIVFDEIFDRRTARMYRKGGAQ